jgi:hypothetical protein
MEPNQTENALKEVGLTIVSFPEVQEPCEDPFRLSTFIKSKKDLDSLKSRKLKEFYKDQNEIIETFLNPPGSIHVEEETTLLPYKIAVYGSFGANCTLFALQLTAAILSGSLALLATTADAMMDVASSSVLIIAGVMASKSNYIKYPTGKQKYKTIGIIVFSTLMATLSIQLIVESVKSFTEA